MRCRYSSKRYEEHRAVWSENEYLRLYSRNVLPPLAYYSVASLCAAGLVRSILTTNYDSFLFSIFNKDRSLGLPKLNLNPAILPISTKTKKYRNRYDPNKIGVYFIHGILEWAQFQGCGCLVQLPAYAVGTNLWRVDDSWGGVFFHDYDERHNTLPTGEARHLIDWNLENRDFFNPEIAAAKLEIEWAVRNEGGLLLLGFMGTHCPHISDRHEELSEPIAAAAQKVPTFMVITAEQNRKSWRNTTNAPTSSERRWLIRQIRQSPLGRRYVTNIISEWFGDHLKGTKLDPEDIKQDYYEKWQMQHLFLPPEAFEGKI